jgi:glycosyltransferase involved in cell wall biosynthesis
VRELDADLVQLTGLTLPQPAIAGRREGAAVVWQLLDTRPPRLLRRMLMPVVTRLADTVMSTGVEVARQYPGALELGDRLVPFVPPVDPDEFRPDQQRRQIARSVLGVRDRSVVVGTVGNRNPQKGHEYLIRAVSSLRRDYPEVVLRVLGSVSPVHPAYEAGLQRELKEAGLDRRSIGSIEQGMSVADVLPGFDVFVLASVPRSEGLPTAILEAMACGVPIVATRVGGVSEIVEEGKTGYLVPPRDPPALADAVSRLLRDDELRADLGRCARKLVQERWGIDRCLHAHVQAYETALAVQARRGALATARVP